MGATQHIEDQVEWDMVLEKTQVVVVDFYADWCGPCKMIGPHFERLADEYAKPKKMAFVKVNTEKGSIGQMYGVRSLPTFKVLHKGVVVETITGANPAALAGAIVKASKLVQGGSGSEVFGNRGQTLGGSGVSGGASALGNVTFDLVSIINHIITILGLYLVSFFSSDAYRSAKNSSFNIEKKKSNAPAAGANVSRPAAAAPPKPKTFKTLADLSSEHIVQPRSYIATALVTARAIAPTPCLIAGAVSSLTQVEQPLPGVTLHCPPLDVEAGETYGDGARGEGDGVADVIGAERISVAVCEEGNLTACARDAAAKTREMKAAVVTSWFILSFNHFSTSRRLRDGGAIREAEQTPEDIEQVVREAKQRFRDTLPKGYLTEEEYRLYERLYGPPLRETTPEDVGIPEHSDMGGARGHPDGQGVLLRELDGGEFEQVRYERATQSAEDGESADNAVVAKEPGYIDIVARSERERVALEQLQNEFETTVRVEEEAAYEREHPEEDDDLLSGRDEETSWATEYYPTQQPTSTGEARRFHPYTLEGRFHDSPVEILLPQERLVKPLQTLLGRTHLDHVKTAAESAFGGRGLPTSPVTPFSLRNGHMGGIGLPPDTKHMTEIEADAFLAAYLPGAYSSSMATLREVRKRIGGDWIQSRLKNDGPGLSVLDAGAGGAGLVAWEQILQAEWDLLAEKGEVEGDKIPGKKTVVVSSDRLRGRLKTFLHNTTFLPRLPDYLHSGTMKSAEHLDSGGEPQKRKSYDIIIASHLFLKEKQDHYRQAILNNLWTLLNPDGGVLIVTEKAHPRGFEAVAHVRDTLLKQFLLPQSGENPMNAKDFNPGYHRELEAGRILAPCTNHGTCPMYPEPGKSRGRKDFCHFSQRFVRPGFYSKLLGSESHNQGEVEFSYVAIQKGVQKGEAQDGKELTEEAFAGYEGAEEVPDMWSLPRIILPPIKRKGHVTLDACTPEGRLERWTVPKSFSRVAYHDARKSRWGDLWALGAKTRVPRGARTGRGAGTEKQRAIEAKRAEREAAREGLGTDWQIKTRPGRGNSRQRRREDLIRQIMQDQIDEEDGEIDREVDEELAELDREVEAERRFKD
ncbi:37S ribosomal protein Rsm22 [Cordyceps fumosorosea ARSEF 2679]|uniref:37S ribosomal protein Rsm22 n=1 Tax=Cordyceps fumosorosea (strain ARSEF 2679) TaxID=1081104 RepID=A0A167TK93_CORFA|nr:37S ribosomal protein Rsm22 [Cordyceps fumosorosea ARSEF 2679]OAA60687.1 37S ribosomal protein Rsm22 [Cordyceps fumosorosea ARSEF 2679]